MLGAAKTLLPLHVLHRGYRGAVVSLSLQVMQSTSAQRDEHPHSKLSSVSILILILITHSEPQSATEHTQIDMIHELNLHSIRAHHHMQMPSFTEVSKNKAKRTNSVLMFMLFKIRI